MPKSKIPKGRMFRDFALQDSKYIKRNYLKNFKTVKHKMIESSGLRFSHIEFLLWGYDLQFFTIDHAAKELDMNKTNLSNRVIYPLVRKGTCTSTSTSSHLQTHTKITSSGKRPNTTIGSGTRLRRRPGFWFRVCTES